MVMFIMLALLLSSGPQSALMLSLGLLGVFVISENVYFYVCLLIPPRCHSPWPGPFIGNNKQQLIWLPFVQNALWDGCL